MPEANIMVTDQSLEDEIYITGIAGAFPDSRSVHELQENLFNKVDLVSGDERRWKAKYNVPQRGGKIFDINKFDAQFFNINYERAQMMDPAGRIMLEKTYEAIIDAGGPLESNNYIGTNFKLVSICQCSEMEMSLSDDEVYITGVSGAFPESHSVYELQKNLFDKVDLITDDDRRWKHQSDAPKRTGKIFDIEKFDASFFDIDNKRAHVMDPLARILHEKVYEAIVDAGYNPSELHQFKVGVYFGYTLSETELSSGYLKQNLHENGLTSCSRSMMATNVSQWLSLSGPTYNVDTACSSSAYAIEHAIKAIQEGRCDMAIAGGANSCQIPNVSVNFNRLGVLSQDGRCKSFDNKANGYCRSEAVGVVFLQKAKHSRRVYASVVHAKANCDGYKEQGITYPASSVQKNLFQSFYEECGIPPNTVEYIEAHGTGTKVGDPEELRAIDEVFGKGRNEPLLIGSVKSNLGHSEAGAGICSLTKLIIAYHSGYIPPNINFTEYREGVAGFEDGRLKVVTEKTPWSRGLAGFNAFGFGGSNVHVLLKDVAREKVNEGLPLDDLPRLVCVSGRTWSAVAKILDHLESKPVDVDEVRLWHAIHASNIPKHPYRGFVLLNSIPTKSKSSRSIKRYKNMKCPSVWFAYSGIDYQWHRWSRSLMKIPIFADYLIKCQEILQNNNHKVPNDIVIDLNSNDNSNMLNSVVNTVATHIALTEVLKAVAIKPDHIIGRGIGKLSAAYTKGTLTVEQTILGACYVGKALDRNGRLPESAGQTLKKELEELITLQCAVSILNDLKDSETSHDILKDIHLNTIVVKVSPAMEVIDSTENEKNILAGVNQNEKCGVNFLLKSLARLFEMGLNLDLANLYPHVQFPVARGTSMFSHLIGWNHNENWFVYKLSALDTVNVQEKKIYVDIRNDDQVYLANHIIDGRNIYPATGYIVMVWKTLASKLKQEQSDVSVVFENISLNRATTIPKTGSLEFTVSLHTESGNFEVYEGDTAVVTGRVFAEEKIGTKYKVIPDTLEEDQRPYSDINLSAKDFYKELNLRGYYHKGLFRGVTGCNNDGTRGRVIWNNNWVVFLDAAIQPKIINHDTRGLYLPTRIEKLSIDVQMHNDILEKHPGLVKSLEYRMYPMTGVIRAGGLEVRGIHVTNISTRPPFGIPIYEKYVFVPNVESNMLNFDALRSNIQIVFENVPSFKFKCVELIDDEYRNNKLQHIITNVGEILGDMPLLKPDLHVITGLGIKLPSGVKVSSKDNFKETNITLFIGANLLSRLKVLLETIEMLRDGCFILSRESSLSMLPSKSNVFHIVTVYKTVTEHFILLRKKSKQTVAKFVRIVTSDVTFSWINQVKQNIETTQKLVLYSQNESVNGLLGLVNCLRREPGGENVCALLMADPRAPEFNPSLQFYSHQLDKDLAFNIYQEGQWGTYRHLLMDETKPVSSPHAFVNISTSGDLSSLRWIQGPINTLDVDGSSLMHVYCSGINFRDVMVALVRVSRDAVAIGRIAQECVIGIEASGKTANGSRLTTICEKGISNITCWKKSFIIPIPEEWTFKEAATIPVAYSTAYMALVLVGKARCGESILIHAGSGGVGQAAISVALHLGLEVFTTVGTIAKRNFIKKLYPQLKDSHISNSRDTSFEHMIQRETNGKGVDLVLNSLADEKLQASLRCLARRGRFLEIGKVDITSNTAVEMYLFHKEISFHGIMLDYILESCCSTLRKNLQNLIISGIESGAVRPLTSCTFDQNQIEQAYRYMAAGKHVGKVTVKIREDKMIENQKNHTPAKPLSIHMDAIPRYLCEEKGVYVLVGGLGGFGLELADWLVLRGARRLLLCSRRGVTNGYQASRIRIWHSYGVEVRTSTIDITRESGCAEMLNMANSMGPVKAVFNLAVVLNDAVFQNQTQQSFQQSYEPKALVSIHLDKLTRTLCPELKNFVLFSSASCGRGNSGQTNYGFSNAVMENICELRRNDGLPALAIQWGAIGDVGLVADQQEDNNQVEIGGTLQQKIVSCLQALDKFLTQDEAAIVSSIVVAEKRFGGGLYNSSASAVAIIMGIKDLKTISHQSSLAELGMDSIMAVEIKQTLEREFEIYLTAQEIRNLCFAKLMEYDADRTKENELDPLLKADKKNTTQEDKDTIELLLRNLGDEKSASKDLVWLPTLVTDQAKKDARNNVPTIFMMSGIENCASTLSTLCSKLKCRACVLQLGLRHPAESLDQMADRLYPTLKSYLSPNAPFYLLGYSFGTAVQLKLAAKLESDGHQGLVICVDCGPEFFSHIANSIISNEYKNVDENALQSAIIEKIVNASVPVAEIRNDIAREIQNYKSISEKVHVAIKMYPANIHYSEKYIIGMIAAIYHRIKVILKNANEMQPNTKLKSQIILIRSQRLPEDCSDDFGLGLISDDVTVFRLDEDHLTIVDSDDCAEIVNNAVIKESKTN